MVSVAYHQLCLHKITLGPEIGLRRVLSLDSGSLADEGARGTFLKASWWPDGQAVLLTYQQLSESGTEGEGLRVRQVSSTADDLDASRSRPAAICHAHLGQGLDRYRHWLSAPYPGCRGLQQVPLTHMFASCRLCML